MALDQTAMQFVEERDQLRKGTWLEEEDERLAYFVQLMGEKKWDSLAKASGLRRSGKSCRLRWLNYLRPNLKHGQISVEEENIILQLQEKWGNKWSKIAQRLPGRTDNEIKNYWRSYLRKKVSQEVEASEEIEKAKEDSLCNNKNESSPKKHDNNYHETPDQYHDSSLDEFLGTKWDNSSEASADFALTNSPYENRLSSWISEYSNHNDHQSVMNYQNDSCVSIESSSSGYLECWTSDVNYSYTWDYYSSSLWDMD